MKELRCENAGTFQDDVSILLRVAGNQSGWSLGGGGAGIEGRNWTISWKDFWDLI